MPLDSLCWLKRFLWSVRDAIPRMVTREDTQRQEDTTELILFDFVPLRGI